MTTLELNRYDTEGSHINDFLINKDMMIILKNSINLVSYCCIANRDLLKVMEETMWANMESWKGIPKKKIGVWEMSKIKAGKWMKKYKL